ncbi:ABC transporter permease [Streptomyces sp. XM4193]|uniref:ABC transporter permease n=1 Tax=Streptomyces sp. XM4193 TaxID=2929782 RepID=UPI001FFC18C2|nr:ABC transporter permease [Streptomyces sp. XM4193]MCK1795615.1 ABC transporter permease [Streptomyces sp. XM4193]
MSTNISALTGKISGALSSKGGGGRSRISFPVVLLILSGALIVLSTVRVISGDINVTGTGMYIAALGWAVPIGLAGLGGLWAERAGVINIGLEGMMMLGAFCAGWIGWQYGPWAAVAAGILGGALGGLLHAVATVGFGVDHIVSGVAINILALGTVQFLSKLWFGAEGSEAAQAGGNDKQSPRIDDMPTITVPGLSDWLGTLASKEWFLVSDTAGILRALVTNMSWLTVLTVLLFVGSYFVLWRSAFGLRLRASGESPVSAESLGVNVYAYKYYAVVMSGALAGLGGAFLAIGVHFYQDGQTGGRGYIGLASMIFGNWRPGGVAMGAGLFGFMDALQLRGGGSTLHAVLLVAVFLMAALAIWKLWQGRRAIAALNAGIAIGLLIWYLGTDTLPKELVEASPYLTTLLVLTLFAQRLRVPKTIGVPYRKGEGK